MFKRVNTQEEGEKVKPPWQRPHHKGARDRVRNPDRLDRQARRWSRIFSNRRRESVFKDIKAAMDWAKEHYPKCSFSVKEQADGPTIISVKGKDDKQIRTVIYAKQKGAEDA